MLSDKNLLLERPHPLLPQSGVQRLYRIPGTLYGASAVNPKQLRSYQYAWEIAVVKFDQDLVEFELDYTTPLTSDVEVFLSDEDAQKFLDDLERWATNHAISVD